MHAKSRVSETAACKSLEQQQDSSPCHSKSTPKKCRTLPLESIKEDIQNRYTAAARAYHQHSSIEKRLRRSETVATKRSSRWLSGTQNHWTTPLPNPSNSSRIRAHAMQKAPKKCLTLPLESIKEDLQNRYTNSTKTIGRHPFQIPRTAAGCHAKSTPKKCLNVTFGIH